MITEGYMTDCPYIINTEYLRTVDTLGPHGNFELDRPE